MRTIQVRGKAGADGVLHLSIPLGTPDTEYETVVVVQRSRRPRRTTAGRLGSLRKRWAPGRENRNAPRKENMRSGRSFDGLDASPQREQGFRL